MMYKESFRVKNRPCPICNQKIVDMLKHLRFKHDIQNNKQLEQEINKLNKKKERQKAFAEYVEELKAKVQSNEITNEKYRQLVSKWNKVGDTD